MIYITSFRRSLDLPDDFQRYSVAVYQPKGFEFPKVEWADIRDADGEWIRPRRFITEKNPRLAYRTALLAHYELRQLEASAWITEQGDRPTALCCWCPYERAAIRQIKDWGSYICHTSVLGEFIHSTFGIPVWYDADRLQMTVLTQRGINA